MTEKLFPDSETFTKDRPLKTTDEQNKAFITKIAKEIVKYQYSKDSVLMISEDLLLHVNFNAEGYDIAKRLEKEGTATYKINSQFIEYLEGLSWDKDEILKGNVKDWVKAHNILPKFEKGEQLTITTRLNHLITFAPARTVYITGIQSDVACYLVSENPKRKGGVIIPFERVETNCIISTAKA